jgi:hypothetical protein
VDADLMQIQSWEGAVSRCAETVLPNAKHDTMDAAVENGVGFRQR